MKRVQELDIALGRLQGKRIHARAVFADAVNAPAVQLDDALVAAADVEDVGEAAVLLLQRDGLVAVYRLFPVPVGPMMSMTRTPSTYTS